MPADRPPGDADRIPFCDEMPPELIELLFDSTSDGVFAVDGERRIIAFNRSAELTLGIDRARALGRPCHEIVRSTICRERCAMQVTLDSGRPVVNQPLYLHDAQGRRVPATLSSSVLHDRRGRVIGCVETFRNLTWVKDLLQTVEPENPFGEIVSDDAHMTHLFEILPTIAASESSILVHGETGTGKSLIARAIHRLSPRRAKPFITINCGALPETLLESELFGYRAGAFTGAVRDHQGRIAVAEGGTVFLDEIGDMPASMQVKLLRFLQDHVYERLGDPRAIRADVRVIAATHRDLADLVEEGIFRRDLYYRINVLNVELPPLRERRRDIPLLAQRCLDRLFRSRGKAVTGLSRATLDALLAHDYPGNIRELENIVEHAYVLCPGTVVEPEHLPDTLRVAAHAAGAGPRSLSELEAQFILDALARHHGNRQETARALGIHKTTLLRKIRKLGLRLPRQDGRSRRGRSS